VKRKTFGVVEEEMLFAMVQPWLQILVSHSVVMYGKKYVGMHVIGAIRTSIQSGGPIHQSRHNVRRIETGSNKLFLNTLR
jgi:hypothetical protein